MAVLGVNAVLHDPGAFVVEGAIVADHSRDASECYGSGPIDVLAMGSFIRTPALRGVTMTDPLRAVARRVG